MASPHKHTSDPAGFCVICYGEGFVKAAELADDILIQFTKSVEGLASEMSKAKRGMEASLAGLKQEADDSGAQP